ncbi:MAG: asparagine synthase (glutamine-hydrolyzing) [Archangiaceae bacterium]|nr:asparagine synthase (glutamine-hydrolyzing) [Archangiaceae bacterium]
MNGSAGDDLAGHVRQMLTAMRHRGPDGEGVAAFNGGCIGMVRLALVDLSTRGQQPIWSPDGHVCIVFNGEIYNYREHRKRLALAGYEFKSDTDTEVILALYLEKGPDFVNALRGMFALAICDFRQRGLSGPPTVLLARDPFGIKPLYLVRPRGDDGPTFFSSELRPLVRAGLVEPIVDSAGLRDYFSFGFVLQPRTILAGVRNLERGSVLILEPGRPGRSIRYWREPPPSDSQGSFQDEARRLRLILEESIRLHAMADTPVGAFLSGGIDSSMLVAMMARHNSHLRTYTLRMLDGDGDESKEAAEFAHRMGCTHIEVEVRSSQIRDLVPRFAAEIDQPSTDGFNTWLISRAAAKDVKGVLSGLGGDEWFSGYPVVRRMAPSRTYASGQSDVEARQARIVDRRHARPHRRDVRRTVADTCFTLDVVGRLARGVFSR